MPIASMGRCEGPDKILADQAGLDIGVVGDVHLVIKNNKLMVLYLPVGNKSSGNQKQADKQLTTYVDSFFHMFFGNAIQAVQYMR